METATAQLIVAFVFGLTFVIVLLILSTKFPLPTPFQYNVFRTVLSLAGAGVAAMIPGFINIELHSTVGLLIRAGGALAVFVIIFFFNPAQLALMQISESKPPPIPEKLPDGRPFPPDRRESYVGVWRSLLALENAGQHLWLQVSDRTIVEFADRWQQAQSYVRDNAIFFSPEDYAALEEILKTADFYLNGKVRLSEIRGATIVSDSIQRLADPGEGNRFVSRDVAHQIQQNKRWLTRYRTLLNVIRARFHDAILSSETDAA